MVMAMDYEQKYKDALENAKQEYITTKNVERKQWLEELFPELVESEDERIRKALVRFHKSTIDIDGIKGADILAWLEKQGNNTPTIIWHNIDENPEEMKELFCEWESDDSTWHDVAFYDEESHTFRHAKMPINVTKWVYVDELLEKQSEQKPTSDIKYNVKADGSVSVNGKPFDYEKATITQKDFAPEQELKKIEDEIEIPFGAKDSELIEESYYIPKGFHAEIEDDKVVIKKGEKPAEWSEEDERMLMIVTTTMEVAHQEGKPTEDSLSTKDIIDWLKSLKDRIGG